MRQSLAFLRQRLTGEEEDVAVPSLDTITLPLLSPDLLLLSKSLDMVLAPYTTDSPEEFVGEQLALARSERVIVQTTHGKLTGGPYRLCLCILCSGIAVSLTAPSLATLQAASATERRSGSMSPTPRTSLGSPTSSLCRRTSSTTNLRSSQRTPSTAPSLDESTP